jgi:hypothetical protein
VLFVHSGISQFQHCVSPASFVLRCTQDVLLIENDINTAPFSPAVHECVPPLPWAVTEADIADPNREDFRDRCICSVDPPGCMDIDDALHARCAGMIRCCCGASFGVVQVVDMSGIR